jgi:hypothetical protein
VVVRNSVLWDLGDGSSSDHVGILVDDTAITLLAANNTIFGGAHGIRVVSGTVTAINNLVAASTEECYEGTFTPESARNLASDDTAPGSSVSASGPVTVVNPTPNLDGDFHLGCGVMEQAGSFTHNLVDVDEDALRQVFDGNPETLVTSGGEPIATIRVEFDEPRMLTGTAVELSHGDEHHWKVTGAMSVGDLEGQTDTYRELVPERTATNLHRAWDGVVFDDAEEVMVVELTVERGDGDPNVHINEWWLDGINPACGQGADLSGHSQHPFATDVDSVSRASAWDIGADQSSELTVGFRHGPSDWWEDEGHALVQVVLSEPATTEVSVRYLTVDDTAFAGADYHEAAGLLTFAPGEISQIISVPFIEDDSGELGEWFGVWLYDAAGSRLDGDYWSIQILEGAAPARVRLVDTLIDVSEGAGVALAQVELSTTRSEETYGGIDLFDHSAHILSDFTSPWMDFTIPADQSATDVSLQLVDDGDPERTEGFTIEIGWADGAELGVPSVGYVRISDNDSKRSRQ